MCELFIKSGIFSFESNERFDLQVLNEAVELLLRVFVFVFLATDSDADFAGDVADAVAPDESVQTRVNANVLRLVSK